MTQFREDLEMLYHRVYQFMEQTDITCGFFSDNGDLLNFSPPPANFPPEVLYAPKEL